MGLSALFPVRVAMNWPPEREMQSTLQTHKGEILYEELQRWRGGEKT
jgi:hypothetical protein